MKSQKTSTPSRTVPSTPRRTPIETAIGGIDPRAFQSVQKRVWDALITPARSVEVRSWLKHHPDKALLMRGPKWNETMLHWAVMAEWGLTVDLIGAGLDVNARDSEDRAPMDWLVERFWHTCVTHEVKLPPEGQLRLKAQTQEVGMVLWQHGGRGTVGGLHPGIAWTRGAAWDLLAAMVNTDGVASLRGWPVGRRSMLHVWPLSPDSTEKHRQLDQALAWGLTVDEPDEARRTPLWHAVDAWAEDPSWETVLKPAVIALLRHGADPDAEDVQGLSPRTLLAGRLDGLAKAERLEEWILAADSTSPTPVSSGQA